MQLGTKQEAGAITVVAQNQARSFQINANMKSFRILSDGLYSDKITAVIRELACNAWDAHVMAGNQSEPFIVHFPTAMEPWFRIRDLGVGLSEDDIYNLYTTYFSSTKDDSNLFIGALGLGSKSPFSYVENFSVTSYFKGEKKIYSAFIAEEGTPSIIKMGEMPTDEHDGLEIQFPVNRADIDQFHSKGCRVLEFFKIAPKNNLKYPIKTTKYILEGQIDGMWYGLKSGSNGDTTPRALMGVVAYDIAGIDTVITVNSQKERDILKLNLDIEFSIGDLEIAASREKLSYTKRTIANIKERFQKIAEHIESSAKARIDACKTIWEARIVANEIRATNHLHFINSDRLKGNYKNFNDFDGRYYIQVKSSKYENLNIMKFHRRAGSSARFANRTLLDTDYNSTIEAREQVRFFINDLPRGFGYIVNELTTDDKHNYVISPRPKADPKDVEAELKALIEVLDGAVVEKISDHKALLANKPKTERRKIGGVSSQIFEVNITGITGFRDSFGDYLSPVSEETEIEDDALYIPMCRNTPVQEKLDTCESIKRIFNYMVGLKILEKDQKVYAYKVKTDVTGPADEDKNDDFLSYCQKQVADLVANSDIHMYPSKIGSHSYYVSDDSLHIFSTANITELKTYFKDKCSAIYDIMIKIQEYNKKCEEVASLRQMCYNLGVEVKAYDATLRTAIDTEARQFLDKYPMLKLAGNMSLHTNTKELQAICGYIEFVDNHS